MPCFKWRMVAQRSWYQTISLALFHGLAGGQTTSSLKKLRPSKQVVNVDYLGKLCIEEER